MDAIQELQGTRPGRDVELWAVAHARAAVYRHLQRNLMTLSRTVYARRSRRSGVAAQFVKFRNHLRAAVADTRVLPASPADTRAARSLTAAADCLGVAGDILAGHLVPHPRTPDGFAVRYGGGVPPAIVEIARVGLDVAAVDARRGHHADLVALRGTAQRPAVIHDTLSQLQTAAFGQGCVSVGHIDLRASGVR